MIFRITLLSMLLTAVSSCNGGGAEKRKDASNSEVKTKSVLENSGSNAAGSTPSPEELSNSCAESFAKHKAFFNAAGNGIIVGFVKGYGSFGDFKYQVDSGTIRGDVAFSTGNSDTLSRSTVLTIVNKERGATSESALASPILPESRVYYNYLSDGPLSTDFPEVDKLEYRLTKEQFVSQCVSSEQNKKQFIPILAGLDYSVESLGEEDYSIFYVERDQVTIVKALKIRATYTKKSGDRNFGYYDDLWISKLLPGVVLDRHLSVYEDHGTGPLKSWIYIVDRLFGTKQFREAAEANGLKK